MSYKIITINREFQSRGTEIAQAVAAKLELPYYDKFLISAGAESSGVSEKRAEALDEKLESRFAYSQAEAAYYYAGEETPLPTGAQVAQKQFELIRELADKGPCVIVGRCANYILRDRKDVLDVFVHAGRDHRVQQTMEAMGLPEKKAVSVLKRTDKARKAYYRHYTGQEWNNPDLYEMILNTDLFAFDDCVDIICYLYSKYGS